MGAHLTSNHFKKCLTPLISTCRKSENAKLAGFKAAIIVNTDDLIFPPGGEESVMLVPTVMIGQSFLEYFFSTCGIDNMCPQMSSLLAFGNPIRAILHCTMHDIFVFADAVSPLKSDGISQTPPDVSRHPVVVVGYTAVFLIILLIAITATLRQSYTQKDRRGQPEIDAVLVPSHAGRKDHGVLGFTTLCLLALVLLTGALRAATLRTRKIQPILTANSFSFSGSMAGRPLKEPGPVVVWNHRETDEVIFEVSRNQISPQCPHVVSLDS